MKDNSLLKKMAIRDALEALLKACENFKSSVMEDASLPAWIMGSHGTDAVFSRKQATDIATCIAYSKEQNRQETIKCPGIIGISETSLCQGKILNDKKDAFKAAMLDYRSEFGQSFTMTALSSKELRATLLGNMKLQHLHFVQSYRHIKLFEKRPARIGFSWAATHTGTVKLTVQEAIIHLRNKFTQSKNLDKDIEILRGLPSRKEVVIKRPLSPHLRANLTWPEEIERLRQNDPETKKQFPGQINTPLPLFILLDKGDTLPEFNQIKPYNNLARQERLQRKDARLHKLSPRAGSLIYTQE